ncbi:MAG: xanthine dehydrogenase small subunit [Pelomonas sp.]|nr:xanthine dehydrogenase small subunit [Roseateles sp.]
MDSRPIRFFHRGAIQAVQGPRTTGTVLQWLREDAHCTGTKEGCAEGDCGACTVLVGELVDGALQLRNVNACTLFLPALDGRALLTVEDLGASDALNPVQQALVDCHGSQCGFCTPGFVCTLQAVYENHVEAPSRAALADALSGNLCRCTGYRPILDAGQRMYERPAQRVDRAPIAAALAELGHDAPLAYADADGSVFYAPRTLDELAALRERHPDARLLAGGTDIALWVNKQFRALPALIYTGRVAALRRIETLPDGGLLIGAAASLEDAWAALSARHPELTELWRRFASPPVRHAGTLGGNVANGSPIGDGAPALIALGAALLLRRGAQRRVVALEDFYLDYMKNALQPGEFVEAIEVPPAPPGLHLTAHKISKRFDSDISAVCGVFATRVAAGRIVDARLVFGGMAGIVKRAAQAEAALRGQPWDLRALHAAQAALDADFKPLTDLRASSAYRQRVVRALLERHWLRTREVAPLPAAALSVWELEA